jgi:hypothetical protein
MASGNVPLWAVTGSNRRPPACKLRQPAAICCGLWRFACKSTAMGQDLASSTADLLPSVASKKLPWQGPCRPSASSVWPSGETFRFDLDVSAAFLPHSAIA